MDTLFFDNNNILLNDQPYKLDSIRPGYPVDIADYTASLFYPGWTDEVLWTGDVRTLVNGVTHEPFADVEEFKTFCNDHFYTQAGIRILGGWNASTNTPTIVDGTGVAGSQYITSVAGTADFGSGAISFIAGDLVSYNGSVWSKGGYVGRPSLQVATDGGNVTTNAMFVTSSGDGVAAFGFTEPVSGIITVGTISSDGTSGILIGTKPDGSQNGLGIFNSGGAIQLKADVLSNIREQQLQDKDGTIALMSDLTSTVSAQAGTSYTVLLADANGVVTCSNSSAVTITIPDDATTAFPTGTCIEFVQLGAGQVTIEGDVGVTINSLDAYRSISGQYGCARIIKTDTDQWVLTGNLAVTPTVTYTQWDPANKGANITLSGGDLTTTSSNIGLVRALIGKSSGKWYWEVISGSTSTHMVIGVATSSATLNNYTGSDAQGWGYYGNGGGVFHSGSLIGTGFTSYNNGDVIGCALDMDAQTIQFYLNGVANGSLITGLGATMYPSVGAGATGMINTTNFGATAFAYTPPVGFNAGVY